MIVIKTIIYYNLLDRFEFNISEFINPFLESRKQSTRIGRTVLRRLLRHNGRFSVRSTHTHTRIYIIYIIVNCIYIILY